MTEEKGKQSKPIPVWLDKALRDRIERVSGKMGEAKSTVMRIAMRIGFDSLEAALEIKPVTLEKTSSSSNYESSADQFSVMADAPKKKKAK